MYRTPKENRAKQTNIDNGVILVHREEKATNDNTITIYRKGKIINNVEGTTRVLNEEDKIFKKNNKYRINNHYLLGRENCTKSINNPRIHISKSLRSLVWDKCIGLDNGSAVCLCGIKIYQLNFECGHIIPHSKGGETSLNNLRPICGMCNKSMGNINFDVYERQLKVVKNTNMFTLNFVAEIVINKAVAITKIFLNITQWSLSKIYYKVSQGIY